MLGPPTKDPKQQLSGRLGLQATPTAAGVVAQQNKQSDNDFNDQG